MGSGYTIEGQKTSKEKHGGLQLEVIPEFEQNLRFWSRDTDDHIRYISTGSAAFQRSKGVPEILTPAELNVRAGDKLRCYPYECIYSESYKLQDLVDEELCITFQVS